MPMSAAEIETLIRAALPDAQVNVEDLAGDGDHYAAQIGEREFFAAAAESSSTRWCSRLWAARMGGALHALALKTSAPE